MPDASATTPLLEQYEAVKSRYPGHLVLFRVGDFFETFGDDARLLSRELDVVLTARAPDTRGERTPMAGVPFHAVDTYLGRLVQRGFKVALCDQVEDARFAKGLVRREVTRVVTPGTVVEDRILGGPDHSFLVAAALRSDGAGSYSAVDVTTGEWFHGESDGVGVDGLISVLAPFQPREVLWTAISPEEKALLPAALRREFPRARLEEAPSPLAEAELLPGLVASAAGSLGEVDRRLAAYLKVTQPRLLPHLSFAERGTGGRRLVLDAKTLRHLEISRPMNPDDPKGTTLLDIWDETVTASGRRTLAFWLTGPLADPGAINARLDAVAALIAQGAALDELRGHLHGVADLARIASRVAGRRVRPPELGALRTGLDRLHEVVEPLRGASFPAVLAEVLERLAPPIALRELLQKSLADELPATEEEGNVFRLGHAPEVDRWRSEERLALAALEELERREQAATGIRTLKVGYNQVFGYYFEVTRPNLSRVPAHFRRRQTVAQAERFTSDALEEVEQTVLEAREAIRSAEGARWEGFLSDLDAHVGEVHRLARALGELDALATFAHLAQARGYVRPTVDGSTALVARDLRHPTLGQELGESYVPNDVELDAATDRLLVLTGPNMSGKSTYMRSVGLLVVLAQAGSFVPARFARVGTVTKLFTRMGFTDQIGRGKSSFMVEMSEVADILRSADERSLVLLDEVGRGTSTFDGLAIAWATLRYLHDVTRARTMLATHYHHLTDLVSGLPAARNAHFAVKEGAGGVVFLHRLVPGSTDRSYGVHVARLAGLPDDVLKEAERLLRRLEAEGVGLTTSSSKPRRSPRYTQAVLLADGSADRLIDELRNVDPAHLTPEQAHAKLSELQRRAGSKTEERP